ncbi:MAG: hypothetical protein QOD06_1716 [Candidatus Binatota bacterium]|jgi:hypothetical protein|nr:hypothetical protein [Candidatus Binatota bacterium]
MPTKKTTSSRGGAKPKTQSGKADRAKKLRDLDLKGKKAGKVTGGAKPQPLYGCIP